MITGIDSLSNIGHVEALPIMTFLPPCGKFRCSNELYNRIYEVSQQTFCSLIPNGVFGAGESREKEGYGDGANSLTGFLYILIAGTILKNGWTIGVTHNERTDSLRIQLLAMRIMEVDLPGVDLPVNW